MDEMIYEASERYFHALEQLGYLPHHNAEKLLLLSFYRDFVFKDYRGLLSKDDYHLIERALDCLYGSTCLIPYPDYLKMGKLHLGEITEIGQRIKNVEDTNVLKAITVSSEDPDNQSDMIITEEDEENG